LTIPGTDLLRRGLLVLLSAIIVARPLVRGEDPGLLSDFSDAGGMALTLLAFLGCAGWAGWRLWSRQPVLYVGLVEGALFMLAALFVIGTAFAPYFRAAWLASWEWVGLLLTFFLVRQLAVRPEEQRGLMAVLLAGAVALSVQGLYQTVWEIPATARATNYRPEEYLEKQLKERLLQPTPLEKQQLLERLQRRQVHGPFFHPASLAACLALFLPMLAGAVLASRRGDTPGWLRAMVITFAVLALVVLLLTRCWSAVTAVGLVGLAMLVLCWPGRRGGVKVGLVLAMLLAAAGGYLLVRTRALAPDLERWRDVWPVSWRLIQERGLRGVGLSQFGFFYPRYMAETSGANQVNPGSGLLELWSEGGLAVVLVFAVAILLFFRAVRRWWKAAERRAGGVGPLSDAPVDSDHHSPQGANAPRSPEVADTTVVRWEYYIGGMVGIVLSFLLRAFGLSVEDLVNEAIAAALQSVAWFAAVAAYERIAWSENERVVSLTAGIAAMLLVLLVNAGVGFPSVVGLLWISIALVLAIVTPRPVEWLSRHRVAYMLPLPVLAAGAFCYFTFIFYSPSAGSHADWRVRYLEDYFHNQQIKAPEERKLADADRAGFIYVGIISPILRAEREDPGNVRLRVKLASWYGEMARYRDQRNLKGPNDLQWSRIWAEQARKANPEGRESYEVGYNVQRRLARAYIAEAEQNEKELRETKKLPVQRREQLKRLVSLNRTLTKSHSEQAAKILEPYVRRDPTNPDLHYHLAVALYSADKPDAARKEANDAFWLDNRVGAPRKLTHLQREQLMNWLGKESER
jgi:hypothetical protein